MKFIDVKQRNSIRKRAGSKKGSIASRRSTSVEVARLAGVHHSTVSRVINNPEMVHEETRQKVQQAIKVLNYRPWSQARSLATNRLETIGLITDALAYQRSSRHADLVEGVVDALSEAQYSLAMATVSRQPAEKAAEEHLMQIPIVRRHRCDGLIFNLESADQDILRASTHLGVPCIWVNPAFYSHYDCVIPDDQDIAEKAVNYLISRGHHRIAYLNTTSGHQLSLERRQRGYEMAMLRAKLEPMALFDQVLNDERFDEALFRRLATNPQHLSEPGFDPLRFELQCHHEISLEAIRERVTIWLKEPNPPTAIVTYSSEIASSVGQVAYRENWRIPDRFSLVSCDDGVSLEEWAVPITAVSTNRRLCGRRAVEMLFKKIQNDDSLPTIQVKGELIVRESVKPL